LEFFGTHSTPLRAGFEAVPFQNSGRLGSWYPTLAAMKLRRGWGTQHFAAEVVPFQNINDHLCGGHH
jgi:hypothetical protein